jgi:ribosomal protein S18 acetylase RimI-like enzyme
MPPITFRHPTSTDYPPIIAVLDEWWGGRSMSAMLPRLFFDHFQDTSFIAESDGQIVGFLIGFLSQTHPEQAYIHFVGVHPDYRKQGLGRQLYERFFEVARQHGRAVVHCVTSPVNRGSIAFHLHMGFRIDPGDAEIDGVSVSSNYDGRGGDRVLFSKFLTP